MLRRTLLSLAGGAAADGTPLCGAVDDPASARARFDDGGSGGGIAVGPDRTVYVADFGNAAIRAIAPGGAVTTVAGGHGVGDRDGGATEAQLAGPSGVAVADDGTLYVADLANNRIRAVAPGGAVRTVAGSGADRSTDGVGRAAELSRPWAVAIARDGSLVVSENHGNLIRQIGADGTVTTLAGAGFAGGKDGPLRDATFYGPAQLAFGPGGELYVADQAGCTVRALTP